MWRSLFFAAFFLAGLPSFAMGLFKSYFSSSHRYLVTNRTSRPIQVRAVMMDLHSWQESTMELTRLAWLPPGKTERLELPYDRLAPSICQKLLVRATDESFTQEFNCDRHVVVWPPPDGEPEQEGEPNSGSLKRSEFVIGLEGDECLRSSFSS
jgi:hypothetical protein